MKKLFILLSFVSLNVSAQDVIVKKDGSTILSKVLEVNVTDVKYKKFSNKKGPTYTISKSEIMSINYENGEKDEFSSDKEKESGNAEEQQYLKKHGDTRNEELLSLYNKTYEPSQKLSPSKSKASKYILIFGISKFSILSNEDIEMTLNKRLVEVGGGLYFYWGITLKNKTHKVLYVDKGSCFRILNNGSFMCYYDNSEQVTFSRGSAGGASIGLGGIVGAAGIGGPVGQIASGVTVGGGSSHSVSTTYNKQRILTIPPMGQTDLSEEQYVFEKAGTPFSSPSYKLIQEAEVLDYYILEKLSKGVTGRSSDNFFLQKGITTVGNTVIYDETESPYSRKYIICYSANPEFKTYSSLEFEMYLHEVIGFNGKHPSGVFGDATFDTGKYLDGYDSYTIDGYYKCN